MLQNSNPQDYEIDFSESLAALWAHKIFITLFVSFGLFLAGHKVITTEKKFTARSVFQIQQENSGSSFNLAKELGTLASFSGLVGSAKNNGIDALLERATGREFIIDMNTKFSIDRDLYFNNYNPDYKDPVWKKTIKRIIGWQKTELEKNAIIENNVLSNYRANVLFDLTAGGAIEISVTHTDPQKASYYANGFMEEIRQVVEEESEASQELRLNYLSETLADALQEMEKAQEKLKNYTLENSALAQDNFISDSLKLDQTRMERRKVQEIADLLSIIENLIKSGNLDNNSYETLRSSHPLVDDINFRRILGMSETISAWTWPNIETTNAVTATLRDRIKRLEFDIAKLEENAQIYAASAEDLAKFRRDAKIAEATYTVLIEQVKSRSLAAGFKPDTFKVFEYATPPLTPSSPNRKLILAVGALLSLFIGCALALLNSIRRNVYYTRSALHSDVDADLTLKSKPVQRLARKSISNVTAQLSKRQMTALVEADLKLASKNIIYVMNSGGRPTSSSVARILAIQSAQSGRNVVLCDTTGQYENGIEGKTIKNGLHPALQDINENMSVMTEAVDASFFTAKTFSATIENLSKRFDQVFICTNVRNAQIGLMALLKYKPSLVLISGLRKSKKSNVKNIKSKQPIDLLFHD